MSDTLDSIKEIYETFEKKKNISNKLRKTAEKIVDFFNCDLNFDEEKTYKRIFVENPIKKSIGRIDYITISASALGRDKNKFAPVELSLPIEHKGKVSKFIFYKYTLCRLHIPIFFLDQDFTEIMQKGLIIKSLSA